MALEIGQGYSLDVDEININDADLIIGGDKKIGFGGGVTEAIYKTGGQKPFIKQVVAFFRLKVEVLHI